MVNKTHYNSATIQWNGLPLHPRQTTSNSLKFKQCEVQTAKINV